MIDNIPHSDRAHAKYSASGSKIWLGCPGSIVEQENYPDSSSPAADEGTLAHEIADLCLDNNQDADFYVGKSLKELAIEISSFRPDHLIEREMTNYVQEYLQYVRSYETSGSILFTEKRVDFSNIVPEGFGTLDASVLIPELRILHIFDLKYGIGVTVDAFENTQGQMYALGLLNEIGFLDEFDTVRIHIVQPRKNNFPHWDITVAELVTFGEYVKNRITSTEIVAGDHCDWCKARFDCVTRAKYNENVILSQFDDLDEEPLDSNKLTKEQKATILRHKSSIEKFLRDISSSAYHLLMAGEDFPGQKLVQSKANRIFNEEGEAALIEMLGEKAYNKKIIGIGDAEKLLGKKEVALLAVVPEGKIIMVDSSDPRSSVLLDDVTSCFDNLNDLTTLDNDI